MENSLSPAHSTAAENRWQLMGAFTVDSLPGNEVVSAERVARRLSALHLSPPHLERLTQAVAAAVLNVIEHNRPHQTEQLVQIQIMAPWGWPGLAEQSDKDGNGMFDTTVISPLPADAASLSAGQLACCWGFFLVERGMDLKPADTNGIQRTIDLFLYQETTGVPR
jgi:hypothetical protein